MQKKFLLQEIVRLKYPGSLSRLYSNASASRTAFGFAFCTSAPVLIAGLGIFLPHGESVSTDIVARWGPRRPQVKTKTTDSLIKIGSLLSEVTEELKAQ